MPDVFISYQRAERDAVQVIADRLAALAVDVWFDAKLRAGKSFDEEITAALESSKAVITCWTPAAMASEWVRGEATIARANDRMIGVFLEPTSLIPPFNLTHAEDLCAWAGQDDYPAWLKLLERLGDLIGRPGLATYTSTMRPGATLQELQAWAQANGSDPLVDNVWARAVLLEGESGKQRIEREKREARTLDEKRKAQRAQSQRLARERGIRDPKREFRRVVALAAAVLLVAATTATAIAFVTSEQSLDADLRDNRNSPAAVLAFARQNSWRPVGARALQKLRELEAGALRRAEQEGTTAALKAFIANAEAWAQKPTLDQARNDLRHAQLVESIEAKLTRIHAYTGSVDGALNEETRQAIRRFRHRWMLSDGEDVDDALIQRIEEATSRWINPTLDDLQPKDTGPIKVVEFQRLARQAGVELAALAAVIDVELGPGGRGFDGDGLPTLVFEPHLFSLLTKRRFDDTHPDLSYVVWGTRPYPRTNKERWEQFRRAYQLDQEGALGAVSVGRYQIVGYNFKALGYGNAGEYARVASESEASQLESFLHFLRTSGALTQLQQLNWAGFAKIYNGGAYAKNGYDTRLAAAYERKKSSQPALALTSDFFLNDDTQRDDFDRALYDWFNGAPRKGS